MTASPAPPAVTSTQRCPGSSSPSVARSIVPYGMSNVATGSRSGVGKRSFSIFAGSCQSSRTRTSTAVSPAASTKSSTSSDRPNVLTTRTMARAGPDSTSEIASASNSPTTSW